MSAQTPAEIFGEEAQELLEQLEQALLDLSSNPCNTELVDSAFRALHTIKGSGAMFGFDAVAAFTHHVETAFDRVRQGKIAAGQTLIDLALASKDHIRRLIMAPGTADEASAAPILSGLAALVESASDALPVVSKPELITWRIRLRLALDAMAMGSNPLAMLDELRELGTAVIVADATAVPRLEELVPTNCHVMWTVMLSTIHPRAMIDDVFLFVMDEAELQIERVDPAPANRMDEVRVVAQGREDNVVPLITPGLNSETVGQTQLSPKSSTEPKSVERRSSRPGGAIRVPTERLDNMMDCVGELVIAHSRLTQVAHASVDPQFKALAEDIGRLVLELRDSTMGVRTVPIGELFGRFRRLVHDLSHDLGKAIHLVTHGEDTELDKTVVEKLSDPLIHLLRNAIDHGLEPVDGRLASGKPRQGTVTLTARHAGAEVLISIADDGRGLDRTRIRSRAEESGLIAPGGALSDDELFQVVFEPGFSTAREVTSLSGRGVGMDVVKQAITALRGKIEISSVPGQGTVVTLRLPLTLAIIDGLLVRIGSGRFVLPLSCVEECVELSAERESQTRGCNFLNIRGDLVPFLRLRQMFGCGMPADPYQKVVIVSASKTRVGLVVDQVIGNHQTVIKSLSPLHAHVQSFSGATILGDGTVALILDVAHLGDLNQPDAHLLKAG